MLLILVLMLVLVSLISYNLLSFSKAKFFSEGMLSQVQSHMKACKIRSAIEVANSNPCFLGRMLAIALPQVDASQAEDLGKDAVEQAMQDFMAREVRGFMVQINYLSLIAQAAPMIGLFGTVLGMVGAFSTLASSGQADPSQLAGNISVALLTTLWGLIAALPALFSYSFFKNRMIKYVSQSQLLVLDCLEQSLKTLNGDRSLSKVPEGLL